MEGSMGVRLCFCYLPKLMHDNAQGRIDLHYNGHKWNGGGWKVNSVPQGLFSC